MMMDVESLADISPSPEPAGLDDGTKAEYVRAAEEARRRSAEARQARISKNAANWRLINGDLDWSHKVEGQNCIVLPDLTMGIERVAGMLERRLTEFGNWFNVETPGGIAILDPDEVAKTVQYVLERLATNGDQPDGTLGFQTVLADAVKVALIEGVICLKVYGKKESRVVYQLQHSDEGPAPFEYKEDQTPYRRVGTVVQQVPQDSFKLSVEIIPYEDHYPDMSGADLYDIHEVSMHISQLYGNPDMDPEAVARLAAKASALEDDVKMAREGVDVPRDPWMVRVAEYWGDLIDPSSGKVLERNILMTTANGEMLRPPTKNPFWHGRRPFVKAPLMRTPLAQTHNAMVDFAGPVAEAMSEVMSLMVDSGMASLWGVRQWHPDMIENADQAGKGMGWGFTAVMKKGERSDVPFMTRVDTGGELRDGDVMLNRLQQSLNSAMIINDIQLGQLPPRQVKSTEIVESSQNSDTMYDTAAIRLERTVVVPVLELTWLNILQFYEFFQEPELQQLLGVQRSGALAQLTAEERFVLFANNVRFKCTGLRQRSQQIQQFQKINTMLQTIMQFPALAAIWELRFSPLRTVDEYIKAIGLDPLTLERRQEDTERLNLAMIAQGSNPGQAAGTANQALPPEAGAAEAGMAMPNPTGDRGPQV